MNYGKQLKKMRNKLERIKKYHGNLEKIKRYTEVNKTQTLTQIALNLHIDHSVVTLLSKNNILVNGPKSIIWNEKIPVTFKLAETVVELTDNYYSKLKSRQPAHTPVNKKRFYKRTVKEPGLFKRLWNAIWNN
jgi:hypothetical protein